MVLPRRKKIPEGKNREGEFFPPPPLVGEKKEKTTPPPPTLSTPRGGPKPTKGPRKTPKKFERGPPPNLGGKKNPRGFGGGKNTPALIKFSPGKKGHPKKLAPTKKPQTLWGKKPRENAPLLCFFRGPNFFHEGKSPRGGFFLGKKKIFPPPGGIFHPRGKKRGLPQRGLPKKGQKTQFFGAPGKLPPPFKRLPGGPFLPPKMGFFSPPLGKKGIPQIPPLGAFPRPFFLEPGAQKGKRGPLLGTREFPPGKEKYPF